MTRYTIRFLLLVVVLCVSSHTTAEPFHLVLEETTAPQGIDLPAGALDPTQGSIVVWWRADWTVEETRRRFGTAGRMLQGYFPGFAIDRPFDAGHWHQLAATWNANGVVRHYVDGELVARHARDAETVPDEARIWVGGSTLWQIAKAESAAPKAAPWPVRIREIRVEQRPLSLDEIQANYLAGAIAAGQLQPNEAAGNRVVDLRLGERRMLGSRHKPMFGFPSMGKDARGHVYLKSKFGGEYNHGNRWKRSTDGGRTFEDVDTDSAIAITKTLNAVALKDGTRIAPDFHLVQTGSQADKDALLLKNGEKRGLLREVAADGTVRPPVPIIAEPPFPTGQFNIAGWMISPQVLPSLDGGMLTLMFHIKEGVDHSATLWLMKSTDRGRTWKVLSEVSKRSPLFLEGLNEATLMRGADGVLSCVSRTGWSMVMIRSQDDGRTWLPWEFLGVDGVAPHAIELESGLSLVTYGRPDVNLLISLDRNFEHWDAPFQIYNANRAPHEFVPDWHQHGTFYADTVEVEPGRLLVIYDTAGDSGEPGQLPQCRLWLQEALVDSIADFDKVRKERLIPDSERLKADDEWRRHGSRLTASRRRSRDAESAAASGLSLNEQERATSFLSTRHDGAAMRFEFDGTALVAQLTLAPDGGDLEVWIDGKLRRTVKSAASHTHWLTRRVLARDLEPGRHEARLVARCPQLPRPFLPSAQELMRTAHIETIRDSGGKTRVVLHAVEVVAEKGRPVRATADPEKAVEPPVQPRPSGETVAIAGLQPAREDVLLHAGFDSRIAPEIVGGVSFQLANPRGKLEAYPTFQYRRSSSDADQRDKPVFVGGLRGQALALRDADGVAETLTWSLPETAVPKEGTLMFWFRPQWPSLEPERTQARVLLNFSAFGPIRKWSRYQIAAFDLSASHIRGRHAAPWGEFWKPETWRQLTVSWSAGGMQRLYVDGELVASGEGRSPRNPERIGLSMLGQAEMDLDELTLLSRQLSQAEIEASYAAGLQAQETLRLQSPAIRVVSGKPVEAIGQQAHGFNKLIRFPELFREDDGAVLLRSDNRAISLHFYDARDVATPAGKLRWFRRDATGGDWQEIQSAEQVARNVYRGKAGAAMLIAETAGHKGGGVYETTLRRGKIAPDTIAAEDLTTVRFNVGIEPTESQDKWLYLNRSNIITKAGEILISGFIRPKDEWKSRLVILSSADDGRSWRKISEVWRDDRFPDRLVGGVGSPPLFGPTQASLLRTSPDRILCAFRTDAALLACDSTDDGRTWSKPWMVGPDGINPTLAQSGDLIALSYGRPDVNIAFSADSGKSWFGFTDLLPADRWPVEANNLVGPLGFNYKPSTGHAALIPDGSNRFLIAFDTNWVSDPRHELPRASLWVTPVSIEHFAPPKSARFVSVRESGVERTGEWEGGQAEVPYSVTRDSAAKLRFEFDGTGIVLVHPTFFDGGSFRVTIDGNDRGTVDLRTPQTWWSRRTLIAGDLPAGKHVIELAPEVKSKPRTPIMPDRWPSYEPLYPRLFEAAGRTRAAIHGFEVW